MSAEPIVIVLPLPAKELSPNARAHWRAVAAKKKEARFGARIRAIDALEGCHGPMWESAQVTIVFYHDSRRARDADNALASLKPALDGLADAGIVSNDRGFLFMPIAFRFDKANPRVELSIEPIRAAA